MGLESEVMSFFEYWCGCSEVIAPKLVEALGIAIGSPIKDDCHFNYRSAHYYERPSSLVAPRCGEHRDFGYFTMIDCDSPGFEVYNSSEGLFQPVVVPEKGSLLLLFGWCSQIKSNGRISACLHRVVDSVKAGIVPKRTSAVLFVAPKNETTPLVPVVKDGEIQKYKNVLVGDLRGELARKWQKREGTIKQSDKFLEEKDILLETIESCKSLPIKIK